MKLAKVVLFDTGRAACGSRFRLAPAKGRYAVNDHAGLENLDVKKLSFFLDSAVLLHSFHSFGLLDNIFTVV